VSDKDERPGRTGALPATAADGESTSAAANPFFEKVGAAKDAPASPASASSPDASATRTATKEPAAADDSEKTAVVRPVSSSSSAPAAQSAPPKAAARTAPADAKTGAATKVTPTVSSPPPPATGTDRSDRSDRYAAAGRGAPGKAAASDQPAQAPRDPDTMAIVRTPARPAGSNNGRDGSGRDGKSRDNGARDTNRSGRGRGTAPDRSGAESRSAEPRTAVSVAPADADRTVVEPTAKPDLAKTSRGPAVPAERMPAPAPGTRPPAGGPDRGREQPEWARPSRGAGERPAEPAGGFPGRYDRAEQARPEPSRPVDQTAAAYGDADGSRTGRRARLRLTRVSPLTVTRLAFAFSLCVFLVIMVAVAVLWFVLNSIGVFDSVTNAAGTLTSGESHSVSSWLSFGRAMQISLLVGAINVILMTLLSTLVAMLYNLCADMIGGIEVTLSDR